MSDLLFKYLTHLCTSYVIIEKKIK